MAGIYIHIPFCRRACHYCDFHFTTNPARSSELVDAILRETAQRADYLNGQSISTIYFGGGTPSLLPTGSIEGVLSMIRKHHTVEEDAEITLETNPEDLSPSKLKDWYSMGINRLSLGTQSFIDAELKGMNRMHTALQAEECVTNAQHAGFDNISIDLIFGIPGQTDEDWMFNLEKAISLDVRHISSYALTVENNTVLGRKVEKGTQKMPGDRKAARFFEMSMEHLPKNGFRQYEISNFAKSGFISRHNASYWKNAHYLGLGPSAHSYNGVSRQWNISSNAAYMARLRKGESYYEIEQLTNVNRLNEHLLTGLRTEWGVRRSVLEDIAKGSWDKMIGRIRTGDRDLFHMEEDTLTLTHQGKLMADRLSSELFF